jgi:hypothetical protein
MTLPRGGATTARDQPGHPRRSAESEWLSGVRRNEMGGWWNKRKGSSVVIVGVPGCPVLRLQVAAKPWGPELIELNQIGKEENSMLSSWLLRFTGIATLCLAMSAAASAQYGGGGTGGTGSGTPGTPGYVAPSGGYGSGKAIGIGVGAAAGAAVAVVLLVRHHHHTSSQAQAQTQTYVTGCTQSVQDKISLTNEKDNQTYSIATDSKSLKAGERMALKGVVVPTEGSGNPVFQVQSLIKDYGACGATSASNSTSPQSTSIN